MLHWSAVLPNGNIDKSPRNQLYFINILGTVVSQILPKIIYISVVPND